jgi:NO-binding membrane sensor protein with MHYT domain
MGISTAHFYYPGDEYGMYFLSSIAGSWTAFLVALSKIEMNRPILGLIVTASGGLVMAIVGHLMDRLNVRKIFWAIFLVVSAIAVFICEITSFSSIQAALEKNGSWWAYIFSSILIGIYISSAMAFFWRKEK